VPLGWVCDRQDLTRGGGRQVNKQNEFETLSEEAKAQLLSLQFVDQELQRLQAQTAAYQAARIAYANALNE
jgi:hypothetical protein